MSCGCHNPCRLNRTGDIKNYWWDKEPGYVKHEVRAQLRRSTAGKPTKPKRPTLAGESTRLANADLLYAPETGPTQSWRGPRAAEAFVKFRRAELGLDQTPALEIAA